MKNVLVTGGAGNVGGSLVRRLVESTSYHVTVFDDLSTGSADKLPDENLQNWDFIPGDVNDPVRVKKVFGKRMYDYVFHYAAVVGVQRTLQNPTDVLDDIEGIKNIVRACVEHKVKRLFYSSSSEVYGEPVEIPQHEETTPLNSRLPYAIVKNVGEAFLRSYHAKYGLNYTIFRFFNTYGPLQSEDFVISKFLSAALAGRDITIYGDGQQTRTFCYIDDNLEATINAIEKELFVNDTINLGSDDEMTILELARRIIDITASNSQIIHLPALEEGDMTRRKPDISKMKVLLNRRLTTLEEGIIKTMSKA